MLLSSSWFHSAVKLEAGSFFGMSVNFYQDTRCLVLFARNWGSTKCLDILDKKGDYYLAKKNFAQCIMLGFFIFCGLLSILYETDFSFSCLHRRYAVAY